MHKNIVFDVGNVIYKWDRDLVLKKYIPDDDIRKECLEIIFRLWPKKDEGLTKDEYYNLVSPLLPESVRPQFKLFSDTWMANIEPVEDIHNLIKELSKTHNLYILSNMSPEYYEEIYLTRDVYRYFTGYVFSGNIKMVKPNDDIYQYLFNKYNLNPSECLFIDDRLDNVNASIKNGMEAFQFDYNKFDELLAYLEKNNDI